MEKSSSEKLKTLTSLALALLASKDVAAETRTAATTVSLNYGRSDEDHKRARYDLYALDVSLPFLDDYDFFFNVGRDTLSGPTPVLYEPESVAEPFTRDAPGNIVLVGSPTRLVEVKTGATFADYRNYVNGKLRYFGKESAILGQTYHFGVGLATSREGDYISNSLALEYGRTFNENNTELTFSGTFNDDTNRKKAYSNSQLSFANTPSKTLSSQDYAVTLRQDINKVSYFKTSLGYRRDQGYLSDPYKVAFFYGNATYATPYSSYVSYTNSGILGGYTYAIDQRPSLRQDWSFDIKYAYLFTDYDSALHLDYRYISSDWRIKSHTFSLMYIQPFWEKWEIAPSVRYYTQHEAFFYSPLFQVNGRNPMPAKSMPGNNVFSSDYRLSSFGSIDTTFRLSRKFLADESAKVTFMVGMLSRRNSFYWGRQPQLKNPSNDFNNYYATVSLTFTLR